MRLTKMGHSCVRLEKDAVTVVIDPGGLTEPEAIRGADALLITHEHFDHLSEERIASAASVNPGLAVWTCGAVATKLEGMPLRLHTVGDGDAFDIGGFAVQVHGEYHAITHPDRPPVPNVGFLVDGEVFHPGDAFTLPPTGAGTLLVPASAPWMKVTEMIEYVRAAAPRRAYSIHEGLLNEFGLGLVDGVFADLAASPAGEEAGLRRDFRRLAPGESVDL
jgi:L-ascorbate metabolism protein UlaG (beta-lactamase superfamily)